MSAEATAPKPSPASPALRQPRRLSEVTLQVLIMTALLAVLLLTVEVLLQLVINPTLPPDRQIVLPHMENVLASIVGFYFGARS